MDEFISNLTYKFMKENYNYVYLNTMTKLMNTKPHNTTLVVGSSHALNGIDVFCFDNAINCSMHTQDIYYDYQCIKRAIMHSHGKTKIEKCFIVFGYYIAFQDVSRAENIGEKMLSEVYYPIFEDCHNYERKMDNNIWNKYNISEQNIKDMVEIESMRMLAYRKQYYSDLRIRVPLYDFGGRKWKNLTDDERNMYGDMRAKAHNKHVKYKESYIENCEVLNECISMLLANEIVPVIIIPPFTEEYLVRIDEGMRDAVDDMLGKISDKAEVIDFNRLNIGINMDDFIDTDHLNGRGAYKISNYLVDRFGK